MDDPQPSTSSGNPNGNDVVTKKPKRKLHTYEKARQTFDRIQEQKLNKQKVCIVSLFPTTFYSTL